MGKNLLIAEILAIGNEVVDGTITNSNAAWLSAALSELGLTVRYHTAIPDDEALMMDALERAQARAKWVLVTGGLGPTVDDFTLEVAAKYFKKKLIVHEPSIKAIRNFFKRLGREPTPNQEKQALLPKGAVVLSNKVGTAPGAYLKYKNTHFAFFPGVPAEMHPMFEKGLLPHLKKHITHLAGRQLKVLRCFGLPEGQLDYTLRKDLKGRLDLMGADLGFRVRFPLIELRLVARGEKAAQAIKKASRLLRKRLGPYVFSEKTEESMAAVVGCLMKKQKKTLALAESCTGGLVSHWITQEPGASEYFLQGLVTYSNEAKKKLLGVSAKTLQKHGAVSKEVALEMAHGVRKSAKADYGISLTGIAGPSGGSKEKPVGTVHIALVSEGQEWQKCFHFPLGRTRFQQVAAATALDQLRRDLLGRT